MSELCRNVLRDAKKLLIDTEWGTIAGVPQCPFCGKLRNVFPDYRHRAGCRQQALLRRIDAVLRQEGGK